MTFGDISVSAKLEKRSSHYLIRKLTLTKVMDKGKLLNTYVYLNGCLSQDSIYSVMPEITCCVRMSMWYAARLKLLKLVFNYTPMWSYSGDLLFDKAM